MVSVTKRNHFPFVFVRRRPICLELFHEKLDKIRNLRLVSDTIRVGNGDTSEGFEIKVPM